MGKSQEEIEKEEKEQRLKEILNRGRSLLDRAAVYAQEKGIPPNRISAVIVHRGGIEETLFGPKGNLPLSGSDPD